MKNANLMEFNQILAIQINTLISDNVSYFTDESLESESVNRKSIMISYIKSIRDKLSFLEQSLGSKQNESA